MRKSFIVMTALASLIPLVATAIGQSRQVAATTRSEWTRFNPVTPLTAATFAKPPATDWPWVRLNMPASADPAEIQTEVQQMKDHGIAGIEVGQGAFPNNEQLVALLTAANQSGMKVSLSHGPTQNPAGYSLDSEHARKTLYFGRAVVNAGETFDDALPAGTQTVVGRGGFGGARGAAGAGRAGAGAGGRGPGAGGVATGASPAGTPAAGAAPAAGAGGRAGAGAGRGGPQATRTTLIAVLAYRCVQTPCPATGPAELDRSSVVDLTSAVTGTNTAGVLGATTAGSVRWTAPSSPAGAQWHVIAFWSRGVFAQPDPFSPEGYQELVQSMETGLSSEVKELMKANGGDLFYDSHSSDRGSPDELWTNHMAEEFAKRRQYPLIPNLPALFREFFDFSDGSASRVRNDFYAVRGDLWIATQLEPLRAWTRKYNNVLRVQVEGEANLIVPITDMALATVSVDRPEHESLFVGDEIDNYLPMASANHMTGNPWYSTECCAALNRSYAQTFQDAIIRMHRSFVGGITKLVYHVYPYRDGPTSRWPGYNNFGQTGFSNAWGPREPYWVDASVYNNYIARNQQVLTQGDARTDVAVYMQNYLYPPSQGTKIRHWGDTQLQEAGYTRDYVNATMLDLPNATVTGNRLAAAGPAYKALIIDSEQQPATDPVKTSMPVAVARRILGYARAGLPVIVVGPPPDRTPGNTPAQDVVLKDVISDLLAQRTVSRVDHESDVPGKLRSLGIRPSAEPVTSSSVLSIRRHDDATRTDYYFFYNQGVVSPADEPMTLFEPATGEPVDRDFSLEGTGRPYAMDAWSGEITPIVNYTSAGGRVVLRIRLSRDNGALIALSDSPNRFGAAPPPVHVTRTTADDAVMNQGAVVIRAFKAGTYTTALSNGRTANSKIADVPAPIDLTTATWHVTAEDWQPVNPYTDTFGVAASQTRKDRVEVDVNGLKAWPEIPQLQHVSGLASYTTRFTLPAQWNATNGATLQLGEVFDSFTVTVNGQPVTINQISAEGDVGRYLKAGANTLTVRVATTLNNRLANLDPDVSNRGIVQPYGLLGPVRLTPYGETTVWR